MIKGGVSDEGRWTCRNDCANLGWKGVIGWESDVFAKGGNVGHEREKENNREGIKERKWDEGRKARRMRHRLWIWTIPLDMGETGKKEVA